MEQHHNSPHWFIPASLEDTAKFDWAWWHNPQGTASHSQCVPVI